MLMKDFRLYDCKVYLNSKHTETPQETSEMYTKVLVVFPYLYSCLGETVRIVKVSFVILYRKTMIRLDRESIDYHMPAFKTQNSTGTNIKTKNHCDAFA